MTTSTPLPRASRDSTPHTRNWSSTATTPRGSCLATTAGTSAFARLTSRGRSLLRCCSAALQRHPLTVIRQRHPSRQHPVRLLVPQRVRYMSEERLLGADAVGGLYRFLQ